MKRRHLLKKSAAMVVLGITVASTPVSAMAAEMGEISDGTAEGLETQSEDVVLEPEGSTGLEEESGIIDTQAPEVKNITLGKASVEAPGSIEVTMEATDDISGVKSGSVSFVSEGDSFRTISVSLSSTYWSTETYEFVAYEDGKLHGTMKIPADSAIGKYTISSISVYDTAGNNNYYSRYGSAETAIPQQLKTLSFNITKNQEIVAAVLDSVNLSTTSVNAPGTIEVTAKLAETNNSDVSSISLVFTAKISETQSKSLQVNLSRHNDGSYKGTLKINEYAYEGNYEFNTASVYYPDAAATYYYASSKELKDEIKKLSFSVVNDKRDEKAPEVEGIILGADTVSVPGVIDVTVSAKDDLSGVDHAYLHFYKKADDGSLLYSDSIFVNATDQYWDMTEQEYVKYEDGKLHGQIEAGQYEASGEYVLGSISVYDHAGNSRYYNDSEYSENKLPDNLKNIRFKTVNDGESTDVTTSTGSANLVKDIKNAADNAVISVDITPNLKISREVFDAIKGTNKTLLLNSNNIQWVFKGSDITGQTKDVDLSGTAGYINYDSSKDYYIGDIPAVAWKMGDNGELPGKAVVRFVPDEDKRNYLGTEGLYVYYYDSKTGELSQIASNLSMTNGNNIEFEISRCKEGVILVTKGMAKTDSTIPEGPDTWTNKQGVEGFVHRLYNVALSRDAEDAGLADWTGRLNTKTENAAKVAWGFFFSEEFMNKNYTDAQYVEMLYRTMFGRSGENEGKQYWLSMLEKGASREYVYHGFAESQEFSNLCGDFGVERGNVTLGLYRDKNIQATGFIARLYTKMLGRKFDEEGLEDWCKKYLTKENTIEEIASHGFLHSEEFKNQNLSDEEFVTRMYETFLDREPEEEGLKDWLGRLERNEVTRDTLVYGFTNSQEFANLKAEYNLP